MRENVGSGECDGAMNKALEKNEQKLGSGIFAMSFFFFFFFFLDL